jgi:hypothetical protein
MPPQIADFLRPNVEGNYLPIIFWNDFWLLKDKLIPVGYKAYEALRNTEGKACVYTGVGCTALIGAHFRR